MMKVKAAPGLKVPKEGNPHLYITDDVVEDVAETVYYLRRLSFGELIKVVDEVASETTETKKRGK